MHRASVPISIVHARRGPADTSAFEISEAMGAIENLADEDVNLIWGATFDEKIEDYVTITIIATGLDH